MKKALFGLAESEAQAVSTFNQLLGAGSRAIADRADIHARRGLGVTSAHGCARSGGCGAV